MKDLESILTDEAKQLDARETLKREGEESTKRDLETRLQEEDAARTRETAITAAVERIQTAQERQAKIAERMEEINREKADFTEALHGTKRGYAKATASLSSHKESITTLKGVLTKHKKILEGKGIKDIEGLRDPKNELADTSQVKNYAQSRAALRESITDLKDKKAALTEHAPNAHFRGGTQKEEAESPRSASFAEIESAISAHDSELASLQKEQQSVEAEIESAAIEYITNKNPEHFTKTAPASLEEIRGRAKEMFDPKKFLGEEYAGKLGEERVRETLVALYTQQAEPLLRKEIENVAKFDLVKMFEDGERFISDAKQNGNLKFDKADLDKFRQLQAEFGDKALNFSPTLRRELELRSREVFLLNEAGFDSLEKMTADTSARQAELDRISYQKIGLERLQKKVTELKDEWGDVSSIRGSLHLTKTERTPKEISGFNQRIKTLETELGGKNSLLSQKKQELAAESQKTPPRFFGGKAFEKKLAYLTQETEELSKEIKKITEEKQELSEEKNKTIQQTLDIRFEDVKNVSWDVYQNLDNRRVYTVQNFSGAMGVMIARKVTELTERQGVLKKELAPYNRLTAEQTTSARELEEALRKGNDAIRSVPLNIKDHIRAAKGGGTGTLPGGKVIPFT